ncbi:hypothetical protein [Virgisporangium ochraceum]|uniref:Uncharacterized protein n=1 Tax=Virgisporangium ochraceum TaxID=65505 RepID=A0A8J4A7H7_9ACTN|nr:hypothetical protein [Virgisporangium ochraceum]GIJ75315.1 hypothetical protein Voc01_102320 [Virgisporangium ochraceum]
MPDQDDPKLPAAQVTPALPDPSDDESPTIQISGDGESGTNRWSGSATVPPPGTPRRRSGLGRDDEDTYDLPVDDDYGPTLRERFRVWRSGRRRPAQVAPPPQPPAHPQTGSMPPQLPPGYTRAAPPPGWYGPPAAYGPPPGRPPQRQDRSGHRPPVNPYPTPPRAPRRRRRRWPWWLLFWFLAFAACCGGVTLWARPFVDQYPASIATEADVPGLTRSKDDSRQKTADALLGKVESEQWDEASYSVLYTDNRNRGATLLATTRFVFDPEKDLTARFADLTGDLKITGDAAVDAGTLGGYKRCGTGTLNGRTVAVCGWADHGSLAVAVFGNRSVDESSTLLDTIRGAVLKRG